MRFEGPKEHFAICRNIEQGRELKIDLSFSGGFEIEADKDYKGVSRTCSKAVI
jgi:hypothetical protein